MNGPPRTGYSLVGMLISVACICVLMVILLNALNKSMTGQGSAQPGTVRSTQDQINLYVLYQGMFTHATSNRGWFPVPSRIARSDDNSVDTTANYFSAMVALDLVAPKQLIAGNEFSGYVEDDFDYDYTKYDPAAGTYWDDGFRADLNDLSNTSYAHMPLFGERYERYWKSNLHPSFPIVGNRGPKDGIDDPDSYTYGRNGVWGGHILYGNGAIEFVNTFSPPQVVFEQDGETYQDNIFAVEDGPGGIDAILSFTKKMTGKGPELQWD